MIVRMWEATVVPGKYDDAVEWVRHDLVKRALFTAGCALLALALAHVAVDRQGWPAVGRRFGANAIAAYVGAAVMTYVLLGLGWMEPLYRAGFADWMTPRFGPYVPSLAFALSFVGVWWWVVWAMDRRGWYLKV